MGKVKKIIAIFITFLISVMLIYIASSMPEEKENIIIATNDIELKAGEAYKFETEEDVDITYEVENPEIIEIDNTTGIVKAKNTGTTKIVVKTNDESVEYIIAVTEGEGNSVLVNDGKNIVNAIVSSISNQTYTGFPITPEVEIILGDRKLENTVDYSLSYIDNIEVGTGTVKITGIGEYAGEKSITFKISDSSEEKPKAVITCYNRTYNNQEQTIAYCSGGKISKNAKQTKAGTYEITCTGTNNHKDADKKTCKIKQASITAAKLSTIAEYTYTGGAITPKVDVEVNDIKLKKGTDYTLTYSNNTKVGTATIKVVGKGNYKGTIQKNFNIVKEKTKAVITCTNKPYNGSERIIATCSGGTISNARQTKPGDYTITCKGDSNHKNADNKTCSINKSDISKATVSDIPNQKYTGSVITPNVVVKQGDLTLKKNVDYTLTYSKNIDAGTAVIVITGKGNYKSSKTVTFKIIKQAEITCADKQYNGIKQRIAKCSGGTISDTSLQTKVGTYTVSCTGDDTHLDAEKKVCKITSTDISTLHIEEIEDQKYTGSAITPDIVIKQGNRELIKDTDYTVIYSNNINKGTKTATAKITGKNGYTGEVIVNFSILEIIGNITLNKKSLSLNANDKFKLTATVDGEGTITWSTGNPIIARVDQEGNIVAVSPGETNIVVKSNNGKTATCKVTVTSSHKTVASYDSATLKYWVEYIENPSRTATHNGINIYNQVSTYMITHIWISNPYNQIKTAIAPQKDGKSYPRTASAASTIIGNEITKLGYQSKGLIAVNAGGDIKLTNGFCSICPSSYKGTPMTPLQIYNNTVIRDSTSETKYITESGGYGGNVAFINKNGNLDYIKFGSDVDRNKTLRNLVNERGAKYTFGLVSPYILVANYTGQLKKADIIATRQAICQIDSNNYILITSHLNGKSADSSCGESNSLNCPRIKYGLNHIDTMNIMLQYGCRTGFNLDGGGSISYLYKTNTSSTATKVNVASKERTISEVLYFVEQ